MAAARTRYGVVITGTGLELRVDDAATKALRAGMRSSP
jgi:hypothetical protein